MAQLNRFPSALITSVFSAVGLGLGHSAAFTKSDSEIADMLRRFDAAIAVCHIWK